jgi:hypothetical protein
MEKKVNIVDSLEKTMRERKRSQLLEVLTTKVM